jgi:hypothetical protein
MTAWTSEELDRLGAARELRIAGRRADGSLRKPVIIWAVRMGDDLYVRSVRGPSGGWFRGVLERHEGWIDSGGVQKDVVFEDVDTADPLNDRMDEAYADKYGAGSSSVRAMQTELARPTTLKVLPV